MSGPDTSIFSTEDDEEDEEEEEGAEDGQQAAAGDGDDLSGYGQVAGRSSLLSFTPSFFKDDAMKPNVARFHSFELIF